MSRYIDADVLFEYILKEKAWEQNTTKMPRYDKGKYDAYYEMLKIIQEQPTVGNNGWIPVSERLPAIIDGSLDHSELYLVTVKNDKRTYVYLAYFGSNNGFSGLFGGDWNDCVTAWQPMPEPCKVVEK